MACRIPLFAASTLALLVACASPPPPAAKRSTCLALVAFAKAQQDNTTHSVKLTTEWGGPPSSERQAIATKDCKHDGYAPGQAMCKVLLEHSSTEFPDGNFAAVLGCIGGGYHVFGMQSDDLRAKVHGYLPDEGIDAEIDVEYVSGETRGTATLELTVKPVKPVP